MSGKIYLLALMLVQLAWSQVGTWERIPIATEIREMIYLEDEILLATDGGILSLEPESQTFTSSRIARDVANFDLNSLIVDSHDRLWAGARTPGEIIEYYDLQTGYWNSLTQVDVDAVTEFVISGDSLFAAYRDDLSGGILYFQDTPEQVQYLDIFENFPGGGDALSLGSIRGLCILGEQLVFAVPEGFVYSRLQGVNLKDPTSWTVIPPPAGESAIQDICSWNGRLLVAAGSSLYTHDLTSYDVLVSAADAGGEIQGIYPGRAGHNEVLVTTTAGALLVNETGATSLLEKPGLTYLLADPFSTDLPHIWAGSLNGFLEFSDGTHTTQIRPNMPIGSNMNKQVVLPGGEMVNGGPQGFSILTSSGWWNLLGGNRDATHVHADWDWNAFLADTIPSFRSGVVEDMLVDGDGRIVASIQGRGVLRVDLDQPGTAEFFDATSDLVEPTYDSDTYTLPTQMALDADNNLWVTSKFVRTGHPVLSVLTPEGEIYSVPDGTSALNNRMIRAVAVDSQGRIWLGAQLYTELQSSGGIFVIDAQGDPSRIDEAEVAKIQGAPLEGTDILQLEVDRQNNLWILTPSGVQSMPLPAEWLTTTDLQAYARIYMTPVYWELGDFEVSSMEVDRRGNRWFLTTDAGVHIYQSNGTWMNGGFGYNTGNSDILADQVNAVAFDPTIGLAYLATAKGISILRTPFADPREDYSTIFVYPQPFNPDIHSGLILQGLMDNSAVKILTMDGHLVRELDSRSGAVQGFEARWDGRDTQGDLVASGVYLAMLFNDDGNARTEKIAVLR